MSKTRDTNLPQHDYDQGHYGELPLEALPSTVLGSGSVFVWDGSLWGFENISTLLLSGSTGSVSELITGNNAYFDTGTGDWTNSGGTLSHDTVTKWGNFDGSLKLVTTATGQYAELAIDGTFEEDHDYHLAIAVMVEEQPSTLSWGITFGDIGTDDAGFSGTQVSYAPPGNGQWAVYLIQWQPSAQRTGVKVRLSRLGVETGTQTWHIGHARAILPYGAGYAILPAGERLRLLTAIYSRHDDNASLLNLNSGFELRHEDYTTGVSNFDNDIYMWGEHVGTNRVGSGINIEVGTDYVGMWISEKDSNTIQIYPDFGDYDIELLDGDGSGGGSTGKWYIVNKLGERFALSSLASSGSQYAPLNFIIDGGGSTISTGIKGDIVVDFDCEIQSVTMLADQTGSIVVDIWKDTYANFPPTDADSITASAVPTISSATKSQDATLTGWTTSIAAGDILRFNVDSVTSITRCTVDLKVLRT